MLRNGGLLGVRREPNPVSAQGVWDVQDAYTADRDGVWPRWPRDYGLPLIPGLQLWLEADYGLYQDETATVPALADGAEVRSWVNRGASGLVRLEPAQNGLIYRANNGNPYLELNSGMAQVQPCTVRTNNYWWIKSALNVSSSFHLFTQGNLSSGVYENRMRLETGGTFLMPNSATTQVSVATNSGYGENGQLGLSWISTAQIFAYRRMASAFALQGGGISVVTNPSQDIPGNGTNFSMGVRAFGTPGLMRNGKIKALVWYSTDEPLTEAQVNAVSAYLGDKWGYANAAGSFG